MCHRCATHRHHTRTAAHVGDPWWGVESFAPDQAFTGTMSCSCWLPTPRSCQADFVDVLSADTISYEPDIMNPAVLASATVFVVTVTGAAIMSMQSSDFVLP